MAAACVAILEDDLITSDEIRAAFAALDIKTAVAADLLAFREILATNSNLSAAIVNIDLGNTRLGGIEALNLVKGLENPLFMTAYTHNLENRSSQATAQKLGADIFITDASTPRNGLAAIVENVLKFGGAKAQQIYRIDEPSKIQAIPAVVLGVNQDLMRYLAENPQHMRILDPRKFEEVIAEIWTKFGFKTTLTPQTRDGGKDIYAVKHDSFGNLLYVIECKRYNENALIGVELVRSLYGVTESERATMGVLATTSSFTDPAKAFQRLVPYRLSLRDFQDLKTWLKAYIDKAPK